MISPNLHFLLTIHDIMKRTGQAMNETDEDYVIFFIIITSAIPSSVVWQFIY